MTRTESIRELEHEVGVLIRRVRRVIGERARAVDASLQPAAYLILSHVNERGPVRASAIVELFDMDKGAISRHVHQLIALGLVDRAPDPADGRATLLTVTDEGARRMKDVADHRRKWLEERLGDWSERELADFVRELGRYNRSLTDS
jgi:DNA-binding MarR family transcriptional regulator